MDEPALQALKADLRKRLEDWRALLRRQPVRPPLRKLLVGRLTLTPRVTAEGHEYEYRGKAYSSAS